MAANLTPRHLEILQHALGADKYGNHGGHRNHFCAGGEDEKLCRELVDAGLMWHWERKWLPYYNCSVTDEGKRYVRENSPAPPKLTRSQKRYRHWLEVADVFGCTFGEWLKGNARQPD